MMRLFWILKLTVWGSSLASVQTVYTHETYTSLAGRLLTGYDVRARPTAITNVTIEFLLDHMNGLFLYVCSLVYHFKKVDINAGCSYDIRIHIDHIWQDTVNQVLDVAGGTVMYWEDPRLQWKLTEYNMSEIFIPISQVWVPKLTLYNTVENQQIFSDVEDTTSEQVAISHTGNVMWYHSVHFRSQCTVKIMYYPFDGQTCTITVGEATADVNAGVLTPDDEKINTEIYAENGEWIITKSSVQQNLIHVSGATVSSMDFNLCLQRRESYYIINLLLPVVFLAFLGPTVFVLPVESGDKAGFSLTILLSLSVVLTIVSDRIPSTSTQVSLLSVYLLVTFIISTIEVVITIYTIRIHQSYLSGHKPSRRFRNFMKNYLGRLVCNRKYKENETNADSKQKEGYQTNEQVDAQPVRNKIHVSTLESRTAVDFTNATGTGSEMPMESADTNCSYEYTYKDFCMMIDKFNFYVFNALTAIITLAFFLTISLGGDLTV